MNLALTAVMGRMWLLLRKDNFPSEQGRGREKWMEQDLPAQPSGKHCDGPQIFFLVEAVPVKATTFCVFQPIRLFGCGTDGSLPRTDLYVKRSNYTGACVIKKGVLSVYPTLVYVSKKSRETPQTAALTNLNPVLLPWVRPSPPPTAELVRRRLIKMW